MKDTLRNKEECFLLRMTNPQDEPDPHMTKGGDLKAYIVCSCADFIVSSFAVEKLHSLLKFSCAMVSPISDWTLLYFMKPF